MPKFNIKAQAIPTVASAYADIIGTTDNQIVEIKNELIIEDNKQHFQIHKDTIEQLAERIAKDGQLSPCIVAPLPNGKYELIDGTHRRRAVIKAGLPTTKCIIKTNLTDKEKQTIRLTCNLIRNNDYLPSELAFAYKELAELEDMKTISEETNLIKKKIYRYIRLTKLIEPILNRVDNGSIPIIAAVEISYLTEQQQKTLFEFLLNHSDCKITTANARSIKENPDDLETVFYGKSNDSDLLKELADKALEPYRQHQEEKVDKLSTSLTFDPIRATDGSDEDNPKSRVQTRSDTKVDKLSTEKENHIPEQPVTAPKPSEDKIYQPVEKDNTKVDKLSTQIQIKRHELYYQDDKNNTFPVESVDKELLTVICEFVINCTRVDYFIFRQAYDAKDVWNYWHSQYVLTKNGKSCTYKGKSVLAEWCAANHMFRIVIDGKVFIMLHKTLEQVVRRYIRENYTIERILSVIKEKP